MEEKKVFCEVCRDDVAYIVNDILLEGTLKDETFRYMGKDACCVDCGSEVYVSEVNDYNLAALYSVGREKKGIISLDKILTIPVKYAIGKRPLSLLLGWGEQTFSRYCDGDMPTRQYSDILNRIYDDPRYYAQILEKNKGNLKTEAAYEKSRKAVNYLLEAEETPKSKIDFVIEYLLNQCEDVTPLALQKALYYIQGFYYAFYQTFLFKEDCEAWVHGPVYRDIYYRYHNYHFDSIEVRTEVDPSVFSSAEKAVLDSVVNHICCYSGRILERFTHTETPWLTARGDLPANMVSDRTIPKEVIGIYFSAVKDKYKMINPNDIKGYTQEMFDQI